jgi:hypothetical protein
VKIQLFYRKNNKKLNDKTQMKLIYSAEKISKKFNTKNESEIQPF